MIVSIGLEQPKTLRATSACDSLVGNQSASRVTNANPGGGNFQECRICEPRPRPRFPRGCVRQFPACKHERVGQLRSPSPSTPFIAEKYRWIRYQVGQLPFVLPIVSSYAQEEGGTFLVLIVDRDRVYATLQRPLIPSNACTCRCLLFRDVFRADAHVPLTGINGDFCSDLFRGCSKRLRGDCEIALSVYLAYTQLITLRRFIS